ncbi:MAG: hypothetical protein Kow0075_08330 [Salibacteraceae bacterium]
MKTVLDSLASRRVFSGVALFARNDSLFLVKSGLKKFHSGDSVDFFDRFQLASLTKPLTASAIMLLVQQGELSLDSDVSHILTGLPYKGIKVRHLLSHRSGLNYYAYHTDELWPAPDLFMTNSDLLSMLECGEIECFFRPGQRFDYSNTNYALLAQIIEEVSGTSFKTYMREQLFEPIGMFDTEVLDAFAKPPSAYPVIGDLPLHHNQSAFYLDGVVGDKGVYSTALDMYKFYLEWKCGELLTQSSKKQMMRPISRTGAKSYYGLGLRSEVLAVGDTLVYHNGWWRGFRSYFWMAKHENKALIILTNSARGGYIRPAMLWNKF